MNNLHQNARTTFHSRALMVPRVLKETKSAREVAEALGVSRRTVYNQIAFSLSMPLCSMTLDLRCLGLNRLPRLEPRPPVIRYEPKAPGDMIHLDINKLGKIDGVGHRIHGDRSKRKRGIGWEYLHVCADGHSRLAYIELLSDEKASTATCFLIRAADWFKRHGVMVRRVMTDNGNGKAERFISTSIKEWAYKRAYESSEERSERLGPWLDYYNQARTHTALNYKPPISRLAKCEPLGEAPTPSPALAAEAGAHPCGRAARGPAGARSPGSGPPASAHD